MRVLVRTSSWAIWARRFGSFALPVAVIAVLMHRANALSSSTFEIVGILAIAIAALALFLALGAFVRLWITGDRGWYKATLGALFSLLVLGPVAYGAYLTTRFPPVTDVTTDTADPPALVSALRRAPDPATVATVRAVFPNVLSRTYPLGADQVFALANGLVQARGWELRLRRVPQDAQDEGQINAIALTLLGWRDEVSIRIRGGVGGSTVAMRSASLGSSHDLGSNGARVEEFLLALDNEVTVMLRDAPAAAAPAQEAAPG